METTNIRNSSLSDINNIRKQLWESVYSKFENINKLIGYVKENFPYHSIENLSFNFETMSIELEFDKSCIFTNIEINVYMTRAFISFINDLKKNNTLTDREYNMCIKKPDMLFLITLNTTNCAYIKL